ncbi:MAG TPA: hypothetical protein VHZ25_00075 [Acidobacteriaceae bacterium]|jgi:hypothetical protein|nr:hypothetical protein [Acidobacteriaceae bacterium]
MQVRTFLAPALSSLFLASAAIAAAQDSGPTPPPKILVIQREYLKPGKAGAIHVKSEANFIKAQNDAKWPTHYIALDSMSGPSRALYMFGYDSFADYGKDQEAQAKNADFSAAIDAASLADGELLERYETLVWLYHPEMSLHASVDLPHQRYWEFTMFHIKPGHDKDWADLTKLYVDGFAKTDQHWAAFESQYGENNGGVWSIINPMRSLAAVDKGMTNDAAFAAVLGPAGMKRVAELTAACVDSVQVNLFVVNPKESYADASWATTAPEVYAQP